MNQENDIVIIGCGAGGGTAAQFARKTDRKANITVFEKNNIAQYSKCGLPYVISGEIPQISDLVEFNEDWFKKANIELFLETNIEKIDTGKKIIYARKNNSVIEKAYSKLIVCTGATPFIPPIGNIQKNNKLVDGVFILRTIDDAKKIIHVIQKGSHAVIVGAGLIGLEMAESLRNSGMKVTIIEALSSILPMVLDEDMADVVFKNISDKVSIITNHLVTRVETQNNKISHVVMKDKMTNSEGKIKTDVLIVATGCKPDVTVARNAGCLTGETGGIIVNNKCETSVKNIYAVGDCTEYVDFVTGQPIPVGLGSIAVRQGITAGINAAGGNYILPDGFLQTCTSKFFDVEIAAVGPTSICLGDYNIISGKYSGLSLPEYYPGGRPITMKIHIDENSGKILSAQAVGDKAAQRVNTFATAIMCGMDVETFRKLETAYAPPIAPTLDAETLVCDIVCMKRDRKKR